MDEIVSDKAWDDRADGDDDHPNDERKCARIDGS